MSTYAQLFKTPHAAERALDLCDQVARSLAARPPGERKGEALRKLRQAVGCCWSVAVAAGPAAGLPRFLPLADLDDPDVAWIVLENAKKSRLARLL